MSNVFDCPSCHSRLRVQPGSHEPFLSCPRCLARVPNPQAADPATAQPRGNVLSAVSATPVPPQTCPGCGKPVEPVWLFCPHCEERLRETRAAPAGVEGTVRRDSRRTSWALIVLALIGALPVLNLFALMAIGIKQGQSESIAFGGVSLLLLAGAGALITYIRAMQAGRSVKFGRFVLTTFAVAGGLVLIGIALIVFSVIVCLAAFSGGKC